MELDNELLMALIKKRYVLYAPQGRRNLVDIHPELEAHKEFSADRLNSQELLFSWYFGCQSSPMISMPKDERIRAACEIAFPKDPEKKYDELRYGFPSNILEAITGWEGFEIGPRIQARLLIEKRIRDIRTLMGQPIEEALKGADGHIDWGRAKDHTDVMVKCGKELQELVRQAEGASLFGITEEEQELDPGELASHIQTRSR